MPCCPKLLLLHTLSSSLLRGWWWWPWVVVDGVVVVESDEEAEGPLATGVGAILRTGSILVLTESATAPSAPQ
jgi:hypothetical protein